VKGVTVAKRLALLSAATILVGGCLLVASDSRLTAESVGLHSTSTQAFVAEDGRPVVLNGFNMDPIWSGSPGQTWTQARFNAIAAKGFNSVRFRLPWRELEPQPGVFDRARLETLDVAVRRARSAGLYVVVNPINLSGTGGLAEIPEWAATSGDSIAIIGTSAPAYLRMLAERYRAERAVAAYDLVDGPRRWPIDQDAVFGMYGGLIDSVRAVDSTKIVLVQPSYGDSSIQRDCADLTPLLNRTNVVLAVHFYFTGGDGDGFGTRCRPQGERGADGTAGYDPDEVVALRRHLESYLDVLRPAGIPLYVSEFGLPEGTENRDRWIADVNGLFSELSLGRAWREYSSEDIGFSAIDENGDWLPFVDKLLPPAATGALTGAGGRDEKVVVAMGDFTACQGEEKCATSATARVKELVEAANPDAVLGLGDFQYQYISGIQNGFDRIFGPKPGGLWPLIHPTAGGYHDVRDCDDPHYQEYWGRSPMTGYSFDVGAWHHISLPAAAYREDCDPEGVLHWLQADLATSQAQCTLAFWQDPYYTRPTKHHDRTREVRPWVEELYAHDAELVIQASNHNYQRFAPQDPDDNPDPERGLRAFVVGTGGISHYPFTGDAANVEASDATTFGALQLTLRDNGYDWRFEPAAAGTFADSGTGRCH